MQIRSRCQHTFDSNRTGHTTNSLVCGRVSGENHVDQLRPRCQGTFDLLCTSDSIECEKADHDLTLHLVPVIISNFSLTIEHSAGILLRDVMTIA